TGMHETNIAAEQDSYTIESTRDYCGNVQYQDGRLSRIMVDGGYCSAGGRFYAFVQDYRGSVRCVGYNNYTYYPDGKTKDYSACQYNDPSQRYQFCGMERDEYNGLDLYDFHARWYDQELCRFTTMDPLCEKYYDISPFAYCAGDPVNNIDPTGMAVYTTSDPDVIFNFVTQLKNTGQMYSEGMEQIDEDYKNENVGASENPKKKEVIPSAHRIDVEFKESMLKLGQLYKKINNTIYCVSSQVSEKTGFAGFSIEAYMHDFKITNSKLLSVKNVLGNVSAALGIIAIKKACDDYNIAKEHGDELRMQDATVDVLSNTVGLFGLGGFLASQCINGYYSGFKTVRDVTFQQNQSFNNTLTSPNAMGNIMTFGY
ncbi:MAG: RHS repeat-associated core domain-containing protein, partial [Bacteroidaceae bacterium]|nr:RHS repeat-associated core domain-containing protein [Bacteroidaceae bacterium]